MNPRQIVGLVVLVLGVLSLVYGGFSYTNRTHDVALGPVELRIKDEERVNVPVWTGVAAIAAGAVLLVYRRQPRAPS